MTTSTLGTWLSRLAGAAGLALVLKVTLVLSLGAVLAALLRRRPAAARHLVWLAALTGALALSAFAPIAPRLPVDLPRAAILRVPAPADVSTPSVGTLPAPDRAVVVAPPGASPSTAARLEARSPARRAWQVLPALGGLWLAGLVAVLLWSAVGHLGLWSLDRAAIPVERGTWTRRYGTSPAGAGAVARVRLGVSSAIGSPLTWGFARPVILLPSTSAGWPIERRRAALLHELAHVERADYLAQVMATLACAVYWFHPLVWWSAGRLRSESEHACDDRVLAAGTPAPEYAANLLEVARDARSVRGSALVAIGMARRSHLEGRLLAVLDEARKRGVVRTGASLATLAVALLLVLAIAGLEPRVRPARAQEQSPPAAVVPTRVEVADEAKPVEVEPSDAAVLNLVSDGGPAADERSAPAAESRDGGGNAEALKSLPAEPGGTLLLDLETGGAVEIRGWDRPQVSVHSELAGSDWEDSRVEVTGDDRDVRVHCFQVGRNRSFSTSHEFKIRVPSHYDVRLRSAGGDVTIVGVEGAFRGSTGGGQLVLERAGGHASLSTGGGDIEVSDSDLSGSVMTGGGMVRLSRVRGGLRGSSGSGPVVYSDDDAGSAIEEGTGDLENVRVDDGHEKIHVRDKEVGFLHIHKAGGAVDLEDAPQGADIQTGGGDIQVRRGRGRIVAHTGGGDVAIGPIAGSVKAWTGAGEVHVILASTGGRGQSVELWSGTGKMIVELPEDLNARFDVETSFTDSFRRPTRITSEWSLEREPITGWDSSEGTPRRHVRAHGTAGNGAGVIHIKTVNGDVELRRVGGRASSR